MKRLLLVAIAVSALAAWKAHAQAGDPAEALRVADDAREALRYLEEEARFLADGAIRIGDTAGWQTYTDAGTKLGNVAYSYDGYAWDLQTGSQLRAVEQKYAFDAHYRRDLELAMARLERRAPPDFSDRYREFKDLDGQFAAAIATPLPDPNGEPDQPGRWECTATWQMNGTSMSFRGQGDSRNQAKAAALSACQQRMGRFCELSGCQPAGRRPVWR